VSGPALGWALPLSSAGEVNSSPQVTYFFSTVVLHFPFPSFCPTTNNIDLSLHLPHPITAFKLWVPTNHCKDQFDFTLSTARLTRR